MSIAEIGLLSEAFTALVWLKAIFNRHRISI